MKRLAIFVVLGVASCQPVALELTDSERSGISAEIEKEAQEFIDAMVARDIERWSSLLRRDEFEMLNNGDLRESYEEVTSARARSFSESWTKVDAGWDGARIRVLSSDAAVFRGFAHFTIEMESGETRHWPKVFFTLLYERRDDGWKISSIHESYDSSTVVSTPVSVEQKKESSDD